MTGSHSYYHDKQYGDEDYYDYYQFYNQYWVLIIVLSLFVSIHCCVCCPGEVLICMGGIKIFLGLMLMVDSPEPILTMFSGLIAGLAWIMVGCCKISQHKQNKEEEEEEETPRAMRTRRRAPVMDLEPIPARAAAEAAASIEATAIPVVPASAASAAIPVATAMAIPDEEQGGGGDVLLMRSETRKKKKCLQGVDFVEHRQLQKANRFSGCSFALAPEKLIIPITKEAREKGIWVQDTESRQYKMLAIRAEVPQLGLLEARAYLDLANLVLEDAIQSAKDDFEWEDGHQEQQPTKSSRRNNKYGILKTEDDSAASCGEENGLNLV